jgi:2-methylfumaryl-CoA isomerase
LLSAELRRRLTGQGSQIRVALEDVALATAGNLGFLAEAQVNGVERPRIGNHLYGSFARDFQTRDRRRIMIVALTRRHWQDLVTVTGLSGPVKALQVELGVDLSDESARYQHRAALAGLLEPWFADRDVAEASAQLSTTSVLWSVYRSFPEVIRQHIDAASNRSLLTEIDQPGVGRHLAPGSPITIGSSGSTTAVQRAPELGEHSRRVLSDGLGLTGDEIHDLLAAGVVGDAAGSTSGAHER